MTRTNKKEIVQRLMSEYGRTYCEDLKISIHKNTPTMLFRLLCFSLLSSARISRDTAVEAARALAEAGWTTPKKMTEATWEERTRVLNKAGYARYDEKTSRMLAQSSDLLLEKYSGDLRKLREEADGDTRKMREALKEFKGIGESGVDIFFREVQAAWDEVYPFADERALNAAKELKLGSTVRSLKELVDKDEFPGLVAALVRCSFEKNYEEIRHAA